MQALDGLNERQRKAVEASDGPVMVIAGPGTGKTKTLAARIVYLITQKKAKPQEILALTFTKKAAEEMQIRVAAAIGSEQAPKITTFHGLCYELLGGELEFISEPQRLRLIKSLRRPAVLKNLSAKELGLKISQAKNAVDQPEPEVAKIVAAYNEALHAQNLYDFDDLLQNAYGLLRQGEQEKPYRYIFADEFQDTNRLQYEILKLLRVNDNLFVIGDPNQSIYGFRGASGTILLEFKKDFPQCTEIALVTNYRSAPEIVRLSNEIFPEKIPLEAWGEQKGEVRAVQVLNEYSEADWVLGEIQRAIGGGDFLRAVSDDERAKHRTLKDFAILYRNRSAAAALQKAIDASGLPYQTVGEGSPYEKPHVQAIIGLMRSAASGDAPEADNLTKDQGVKAAELLAKYADASPETFMVQAMKVLGVEPNRDSAQLLAVLARFKTIPEAVRYFDDIAENGFYDPQADAITLLTIHASKGLEFSCVFLVGMQEGILPSDRGDKQEERRLFYVAVTRAKKRLEILYTKNRGASTAEPSSFLKELPASVLERLRDPDMQSQARRIAKRQAKRSQQSLF